MEEIERKAKTIGMQKAFVNEMGLGLNKREWFAGMALQGLLAHPVNHAVDACVSMSIFAADCILKKLAESDGAK